MSCISTSLRSLLVACVLTLPVALSAADKAEKESTPLHEKMDGMSKALRAVNKIINSAEPGAMKEDALAGLQTMQQLAVEAKTLTPATNAKLPEAERPAALAAYRAELAEAIETLLEMERAILKDDWAQAKELMQKVRGERKEGHEKYNPDEEKH